MKSKRNKTRRKKNKARTKKRIRGGLFGWFGNKNKIQPLNPTQQSNPMLNTTQQSNTSLDTQPPLLITKSNDATKDLQKTQSLLTLSKGATAATLATGATIATISNVGYGAVAGLTASGIGIPLAGALAGALLIANKLSNMYITNHKLFPIMYDSMSILSNGYKLHELIESAYKIIQGHLKDTKNILLKSIRIDPEILSHISTKVTEVTAYLLKITDENVLTALQTDPDIINSGFNKAIDDEIKSRKKDYFKRVSDAQRKLYRFLYASEYKTDISENLGLINGFFIIIKTQYDFALELYEQEIPQWKEILKEIHSSDQYISYMVPANQNEIVKNAILAEKDNIGKAAVNVNKEINVEQDINAINTANA